MKKLSKPNQPNQKWAGKKTGKFSLGMFSLVICFLYMPLIILVVYSFNESRMMNWGGFSLRWYEELFFSSGSLWQSFGNSAMIAVTSATVSTLIGTLGAIGLYWYNFRFRKAIQLTAFLPMLIPEIIIGVSLLIFFAGLKFQLSLFTIFLAHTTFNIPFVLLVVMARLEEFDFTIIEAAYDLGAREFQALLKVILPTAFPGIMSGFLIAVTLSLEDFVITFFVSGPGSSTLPLHIYSMIRFGVSPVINALSVIVIAGTVVLAVLSRNVVKLVFQQNR
ncbi:MAG: ABC transporter permease [Chitinispirillales bacterium]|jgi:spermidine/putrescine transport system permease protein|nr:ABC transporter permease [Chitinispirillales bacterium]